MSSLFEANDQILDELETAEHRLEKIRIEGSEKANSDEKSELAAELKSLVTRMAANVEASGGKVEKLGGAVVLADLLEVLERYGGVFKIAGIDKRVAELKKMIDESGG